MSGGSGQGRTFARGDPRRNKKKKHERRESPRRFMPSSSLRSGDGPRVRSFDPAWDRSGPPIYGRFGEQPRVPAPDGMGYDPMQQYGYDCPPGFQSDMGFDCGPVQQCQPQQFDQFQSYDMYGNDQSMMMPCGQGMMPMGGPMNDMQGMNGMQGVPMGMSPMSAPMDMSIHVGDDRFGMSMGSGTPMHQMGPGTPMGCGTPMGNGMGQMQPMSAGTPMGCGTPMGNGMGQMQPMSAGTPMGCGTPMGNGMGQMQPMSAGTPMNAGAQMQHMGLGPSPMGGDAPMGGAFMHTGAPMNRFGFSRDMPATPQRAEGSRPPMQFPGTPESPSDLDMVNAGGRFEFRVQDAKPLAKKWADVESDEEVLHPQPTAEPDGETEPTEPLADLRLGNVQEKAEQLRTNPRAAELLYAKGCKDPGYAGAVADLLVLVAPQVRQQVVQRLLQGLHGVEGEHPSSDAHAVVLLLGELFVRKVVQLQVVKQMFAQLVFRERPLDHAVQLACHLLLCAGPTLDQGKVGRQMVEYVCLQFKELRQAKYTPDTRHCMQQVEQLRHRGWTHRVEVSPPVQRVLEAFAREGIDCAAQGFACLAPPEQLGGVRALVKLALQSATSAEVNLLVGLADRQVLPPRSLERALLEHRGARGAHLEQLRVCC